MREVETQLENTPVGSRPTNLYFIDICFVAVLGIAIIVGGKVFQLLGIIPSVSQISDTSFGQAFLLQIIYVSIWVIPTLLLTVLLSIKNNRREAVILNSRLPNPFLMLLADRQMRTFKEIDQTVSELPGQEKETLFSELTFSDTLLVLMQLNSLGFVEMQRLPCDQQGETGKTVFFWITDKGREFLRKQQSLSAEANA